MSTIRRGSTVTGAVVWGAAQPIALVNLNNPIITPPPVIPPVKPPVKPPMSTLTLRANNGQYVCAELDGTMNANRDAVGSWERFAVESVDGGKFALKSAHGKYVCAEGGGGGPLIANRTAIGGWEKFRSVPSGIGIALETDNGHFWCAEEGGGREVNATRTVIGAWETFNGPAPTIPPVPGAGRTGQVRGEVFATADTGGAWLALGTTFFWGLWGWLNDRDRCLLNVQSAIDANVDYLRVLGTVGPDEGWADRAVDCSQPGWAEDARQFTDACFARGIRVQWSIFGSTSFAPTREARRFAVASLCTALAANPQAVFSIEIANEGWQNGFEGSAGATELRELANLARSLGPWVVATTAPNGDSCDIQAPYYKDSGCTFSTLHFARTSVGEGGDWRYVRQPWREGSRSCTGQTRLYSNNEPKELAGKGDWNVLRVADSAVISWQCNVGAYVLHTGAGIRGGGSADMAVGRAANLWEVPGWSAVTGALAKARATLPTDLTNWSRGSSKPTMWDVSSWEAVGRVYSSTQGRKFLSTPHNISKPLTLTARQPLTYTVYDPLEWTVLSTASLAAGNKIVFSGTPAAVVILGTLM